MGDGVVMDLVRDASPVLLLIKGLGVGVGRLAMFTSNPSSLMVNSPHFLSVRREAEAPGDEEPDAGNGRK